MAETAQKNGQQISFKDTLNLPKTDFPIRPNAAIDDPLLIARWEQEKLYEKTFTHHNSGEKFIFHDGPPYANGPIHTGSAYNKILKDIVTKAQRMMGKQVPVTPGWDCHGLPIEIKVTQEQPNLTGAELKKACRAYAQRWINIQRTEFKRLGVIMDWDRPYLTMDPSYQASIMRVFGICVHKGLIERKNKTVPWCMHCKTVLASAEIEYQDRKDPSVYVFFPLSAPVIAECIDKPMGLVVWTTTPWTLPLNQAVLLKPDTCYVVLDTGDKYILVGESLADALCAIKGITKKIVGSFISNQLIQINNLHVYHPVIPNKKIPILLDDSVATSEGTACVHCAPGAGPIDYEIGIRNHLEIYSPVSPSGSYIADIQPHELANMPVTEGQWWVLKKLQENRNLFHKTSITHSYPHCWRCRNSLIFRATKQWFFDLEKHQIKEKATYATYHIKAYPEKSINRLRAMLEGRLEWCLSRQRIWGVPIPALLCTHCDTPLYSQELANRVADQVAQHGIEWWDSASIHDIMPKEFSCASCHGTECTKEMDILDVWFDSGISHYAVLAHNQQLGFPADLYLEGSDQHRGWFQSSLLTSIAIQGEAPMKGLYTHGFVVDEKGHKMSKSLGNVIAPAELIERLGTDGLRMWAASVDNAGEAVLSPIVLNNVQEVFRKARNTLRFLLSNLYDFDPSDQVAHDQLLPIDAYAIQALQQINKKIIDHYASYDLTGVYHALGEYCATELSALYLDIIKDRLYVEKADGHKRRSAQTACYFILDTLTRLVAPIMSFTAEQVSDLYQKQKIDSIHLQTFANLSDFETSNIQTDHTLGPWNTVLLLRDAILKALEAKRETGLIKHSLEARVTLYIDPQAPTYQAVAHAFQSIELAGQAKEEFLREFAIVSQLICVFQKNSDIDESGIYKGVSIQVEHAYGAKCPRCWQWDEKPQKHDLCRRCLGVLS